MKTAAGQVRGYVDNGVQVFKSVRYGASTAGAGRFLPPQKPQPWTGVRDAFDYEGRAPQVVGGEPQEMLYTDPREPQSEDCLRLHLWTPATTGRRPVMVWLHGGGFFSGSGSYGIYSGRELARRHDVVSIALNHRLNAMGFLHLAAPLAAAGPTPATPACSTSSARSSGSRRTSRRSAAIRTT